MSYGKEFSELIRLAGPISLGYVGMLAMGFVDILFVGHCSTAAVGAVGVGTSVFTWGMIFCIGLLTSLDYCVSFSLGEGRRKDCQHYWVQSLWLAVGMGVGFGLFLALVTRYLGWFGIDPTLLQATQNYLSILNWSLLPVLVFTACRHYLQALGDVRTILWAFVWANGLNAGLNWLLVFGHWGFPELGMEGSAWATGISRVFMAAVLLIRIVILEKKSGHPIPIPFQTSWGQLSRFYRIRQKYLRELWTLGLPASLHMLFEVGVFSVATVLAAKLSSLDAAAHQIVLQTAGMAFMVPLGLGIAAAVSIGKRLGEKRYLDAIRVGDLTFILSIVFMSMTGLAFALFPRAILGLYTTDEALIDASRSILGLAALFQIFDGIQGSGGGVLRGVSDTKTGMLANLIGHWVVAFPLLWFLAFTKGRGLPGIWTGLTVGLIVVATWMGIRWYQHRHALQKLQLSEDLARLER